jgi:uncharacterized FlaG/YvyC family protein
MGILPVNGAGMVAPVSSATPSRENLGVDRQIVAAVQKLNNSELMGQDRELAYRHDPKTGQAVIQILKTGTDDVIEQIPPELVLQLRESLEQELKRKATEE